MYGTVLASTLRDTIEAPPSLVVVIVVLLVFMGLVPIFACCYPKNSDEADDSDLDGTDHDERK